VDVAPVDELANIWAGMKNGSLGILEAIKRLDVR